MKIDIKKASWVEDSALLHGVRRAVFIEEQSVPEELEWDGEDEKANHWLATAEDGTAIGTVRLLANGHIGRMAVLADYRNCGVGKLLLHSVIQHAREKERYDVFLYAQTHAIDFYSAAGFSVEGEEFLDAGIPHRTMRRVIAERRLLGKHGGKFFVRDIRTTTLDLVKQTTRNLDILSFDMAAAVYDTEAMAEAISTMARLSRYSAVRLLVVDTLPLTRRGHRILNLQRRLSSSIQCRKVSCLPGDIKDNLVLADNCGILCQSVKDPEQAWANFNNRPVVEGYQSQFNELWHHSIDDPQIRQLSI